MKGGVIAKDNRAAIMKKTITAKRKQKMANTNDFNSDNGSDGYLGVSEFGHDSGSDEKKRILQAKLG